MPLDAPTPGSPENWLCHARSDLALAQQRQVPEVLLAALCFHAQQAVEKSLKAVLLQRGITFPYTHDLARLPWPEELEAAAALTVYAAGSRYPGPTRKLLDPALQMTFWLPAAEAALAQALEVG